MLNEGKSGPAEDHLMTDMLWEVFAVKYADRNNRMRLESFILDPAHD